VNLPNTNILEKPGLTLPAGADQPEETVLHRILGGLHRGRLEISLPSGSRHVLSEKRGDAKENSDGPTLHASLHLLSYKALRRMIRSRSIGFAEGYIEGDWHTPDLPKLMELMVCNMDALEARLSNSAPALAWNRLRHLFRTNTKVGSRRNIAYHYDLGNDFYIKWLDESMTYSSGLFDSENQTLADAQRNKYQKLADELDLQSHHRVLEIGCGWGGFAEFAARNYGCHVTCLTLSREQLDFARERIDRAGLSSLVELRLQDYREVSGQFDRIVSIEMFEAVGESHWAGYFEQLRRCLKPEGRAGLQIITISNERFEGYRSDPDFIQKYVFPGGMLPSPEKLHKQISSAGLNLASEMTFAESYARTLKIWREAFLENTPSISGLGHGQKFRRMWEYYLCYCEAGFRHGTVDVGHYILTHE
jgi:cyclopropane-fatty-acyl-phospholipid synthase